jgi:hypothetical protein
MGTDSVLGPFLQIMDERYRTSGHDQQGEGYVLDWDQTCGFNTNLINAKKEDIVAGPEKLQELVETFIRLME